jgi:hypothetical protein
MMTETGGLFWITVIVAIFVMAVEPDREAG